MIAQRPIKSAGSHAGYHHLFIDGSIEVFWDNEQPPGWYWWARRPGCLPDGERSGPFLTSFVAFQDAIDPD